MLLIDRLIARSARALSVMMGAANAQAPPVAAPVHHLPTPIRFTL